MTDIWDEKPHKRGGAMMGDHFEWRDHYYDPEEMDTWLEKVKPYLDLAEQVIETFNGQPSPEDSIMFFQGRTILESHYDWLREVKEKAEKWDNLIEKSSEAPYIDCIGNAEKLEAIKYWIETEWREGAISLRQYTDLKILFKRENTGVTASEGEEAPEGVSA